MSIKNDRWIRRMAEEHGMIEPFETGQIREGTISYGLSSYGYDIRVAPEFKVFTNVHNVVVDPKEFDARSFVDVNIAQLLFFQGDEEPEVAYADRKGKYQDQRGVTLAKL